MIEASISVGNAEELVLLLGTKDQHLRQIRGSIPAKISTRDGKIVVQGDEDAVIQATAVLEELRATVGRNGPLDSEQVAQIIHRVTGNGESLAAPPIDIRNGRKIRPRTPGQAAYVQAIRTHDLVLCTGPAGTGKTYLAVATAVEALKEQSIRKIVLVRPAVEAGESLGFLPGDLQAKINPYLRPLLDALREMMDHEQVRRYMDDDVIEVVPLAYMRGRTLNNAFIIMDEAQNTTVSQMKMFLTRMGEGSKMVVSGDISQVDLPSHAKSGLIDALHRLRGIEGIASVRLDRRRHRAARLVQEIVRAYEEATQRRCSSRRPAKTQPGQQRSRRSSCRPACGRRCGATCSAAACCCGWRLCAAGRDLPVGVHPRLGSAVQLPAGRRRRARAIVARVDFKQPDPDTTEANRRSARARRRSPSTIRTPSRWCSCARSCAPTSATCSPRRRWTKPTRRLWEQFQPTAGRRHARPDRRRAAEAQFQRFRDAFAGENALEEFSQQLAEAMAPLEQQGLLDELPPEHDNRGERREDLGAARRRRRAGVQVQVNIADVLITDEAGGQAAEVAQRKAVDRPTWPRWSSPGCEPQLAFDARRSNDQATEKAPGRSGGRSAGRVHSTRQGRVRHRQGRRTDHRRKAATVAAGIRRGNRAAHVGRSASAARRPCLGMFVALYTLGGFYLYVRDRRAARRAAAAGDAAGRCSSLTVTLATIVNWYAGAPTSFRCCCSRMIVAIAYQQEMALLLSACVTLVVVVSLGHGLAQALVLERDDLRRHSGAAAGAQAQQAAAGRLRRGGVGFFTTLGVGTLDGQAVVARCCRTASPSPCGR